MRIDSRLVSALACAAACAIFSTTAAAASLSPEKLLDICAAPTVADAQARGDALGWTRMTEADFREWRESFVGYNKGEVDVIGWRQPGSEKSDALSFWVARGPNAHRACTYSMAKLDGALEALTRVLGKPESLEKNEVVTTAVWVREGAEIYYSAVGDAGLVSIGYDK